MLKNFTFKNSYSFRDETVFTMEARTDLKDNYDFIIKKKGDEGSEFILPVAAVYGANAGGKSNLLRALIDSARTIRDRGNLFSQNTPFVLVEGTPNRQYSHCLNLLIGKYEYRYSYTASFPKIITEKLEKKAIGAKDDFENVFERKGNHIDYSNSSLSVADRDIINRVLNKPYALIVNLTADMEIQDCSNIYNWARNLISSISIRDEEERERYVDAFGIQLYDNEKAKKRFLGFIKDFDTSIDGVNIEPYSEEFLNGNVSLDEEDHMYIIRKVNKGSDKISFPLYWESNGTQKIMELYPSIIDALDNGKTLVIDELDTMLHPVVFKRIVEIFHDRKMNKKNAQLIFSAHNTIVMNRKDLRRDEIHIISKTNEGISHVHRFSDFTDESGENAQETRYDKLYLEGLLGSFPTDFLNAKV